MRVFLLIRQIFADILHSDERMHLDAELLANFHDRGLARGRADLAAVDRNEHIGHLHIRAAFQHRHGFADRGACGNYVLNDNDTVPVLRLVANDAAALAVVLCLLAVEEKGLINPVIAGKRAGNRGRQRDALVRRAEHRVEIAADRLLDERRVKLAQAGIL